jgi:predicted porin
MSSTNGDPQQKNGIGSRNSYVGLWSPYGAIKIGKTDAPYKTSTAKMDPFDRTTADYNSIIGNSGGDNRAEFDTRLAHAVWYESPNVYGFNLALLWSPGQNRGTDNTLEARGEPNCTGGNGGPGSPPSGLGAGGSGGGPCTDGSYGDAFSAALTYTNGPLYIVTAGELHRGVNRTSDDPNYDGVDYGPQTGIHNEYALKAGLQYKLALTGTTFNFLYEYLKRDGAYYYYNERTRPLATWVAITQELGSPSNVLNIGWAHAGKSPGSPMYTQSDGTVATGPVRNSADMWAVGLKHYFDKNTNIYLVGNQMLNSRGAHYDLGASGHGTVVDDKDGTGHSRMGTTLTAITLGMQYKF